MRLRLGVLAVLAVLAFTPNALANSYTYTTSGCFSGGTCGSNSSVNFTDLLGGDATLSFTGVSAPTTTNGSSFTLGSFDLTSLLGVSVYNGSFTLNVDFSNPNASGSPLVASVLGGVLINAGGAIITFSPGSQVFTYPGGSFTLSLITDPVIVTGLNQSFSLNAQIAAVSMPEGSSLVMLAISGLVLVGAFFKKRNALATSGAC